MPTEQEAKPAVVTPSLQQWRSPSTFRGAPGEDPLKWLKEYDRVANFNKKYRAPVQKFPPEPRKTDVWRTADNRPVCFTADVLTCNALPPRERKAVFDNSRNRRRNSTTLALKKKYADQTLPRRFTPSPMRGRSPIRRYRSPSPYRRSSQSPGRRSEENKESDLPRSHDVILGWTFRGVSSRYRLWTNELVLEDICRDSTTPDAWNLYATRDYTLKPHS
ncbi:hypothetical protein TNCV_4825531 [Trichonephila clavipes]|uniref:Uncharacterized protein n=1 Tax=Trichonephila clavipes TaxID=2585209 RepID=A0A8X6V5S7_TRICX|nr:hypothetical protein TNCV_4825531 [Trichonephila clavipes]